MDVHKMLEQVKAGQMDIAEAEAKLKDLPYEDLGYAKLDHHRKLRSGFGETVFCQGKPDAYLLEIYRRFYERDGEVLGTRATGEQFKLVQSAKFIKTFKYPFHTKTHLKQRAVTKTAP